MPVKTEMRRLHDSGARIEAPAPTAWPMVLAVGVTLSIAGMVTEGYVTALGILLFLFAARGWAHQVLPREQHELLPISPEQVVVTRSHEGVAPVEESGHQQVQSVESFSLVAGLYGGVAGGLAMTVPAALYGLIKYGSIWYAVNLLAAGGFPSWAGMPNSFFAHFHLKGLIVAVIIHALTSVLVGLLYAALLPIYPKRPILTAGIIVPLFWTALLWGVLGLISPILNQRIDWWWFIPSQLAFGLVTGYVVNRFIHVRSPELQKMSLDERAGVHSDVSDRESGGEQ